jgi:hypothetical protein
MQTAVQDVTAGRRGAKLEQGGLTGDADCCAGCNSGSSDPVDLPSTPVWGEAWWQVGSWRCCAGPTAWLTCHLPQRGGRQGGKWWVGEVGS